VDAVSAVLAWVRVDLRGRRRSLLVLALLVALTTGVVTTAVAGSRRGATAVQRLADGTLPATVAALPNQPGFDWEAVRAIPGVAALVEFPVSEYVIDGLPPEVHGDFAYGEGIMRDLERPVLLDGRLADPERDDEAVVSATFPARTGKGVGDTVTIRLYSPEQMDRQVREEDVGDPAGPAIETTIVGVVRSPWFTEGGQEAGLVPSPALFAEHRSNLVGTQQGVSVNALIRLDGGGAAIPAFQERLAEVSGRSDIDFFNLVADRDHQVEVTRFEADALLAFALAALVAALFLVGQSVARFVAGARSDLRLLVAIGMPPWNARVAAVVGPTLAALVGAVGGLLGAWAASSHFPIGSAALLEPTPGTALDLPASVVALVLVPTLVAAGAALAAWVATRSDAAIRPQRPSIVASLAARLGAPVPVAIGSRFALERGRGSQAVPVVPALVGSIVGVVGVVAALTFSAGVSDVAAHPERFGQVADLRAFVGFNGEDFVPSHDAAVAIAADPDVLVVNDTRQAVADAGADDVPVFVLDPVDEPLPVVLTAGRMPARADEVLLTPGSAADAGMGVGDRIELTGNTDLTRPFLVSGLAFVPEGPHNTYDEGAWMPKEPFDDLFEGFKFHIIDVVLRTGADPAAVAARIGAGMAETTGAPTEAFADFLEPPDPPSRLEELQRIAELPRYLAAFLALLAVAAVGHAVATAVRRRRHDLAVLRALGVTRLDTRVTVLVQATVLAIVGLVVGVPLGLALGRTLWRSVADSTPLAYVPPLAVLVLVAIGPAALLAANLLAALPSQRAASLRVAHVLRTE
jgi:hypothetical protein